MGTLRYNTQVLLLIYRVAESYNKMVNSSNGPAAKLLAWSADRIPFEELLKLAPK